MKYQIKCTFSYVNNDVGNTQKVIHENYTSFLSILLYSEKKLDFGFLFDTYAFFFNFFLKIRIYCQLCLTKYA